MKNISAQLARSALYPASLMVLLKIGGIFLANYVYRYQMHIQNEIQGLFSVQVGYENITQVVNVTVFSNTLMLAGLTIGAVIFVIRAFYMHNSHESPKVHIRLAEFNLLSLLGDSFEIYTHLFSWITYLWIATGIIFIDTLSNKSPQNFLYATIIVSVIISALALKDVQYEISGKNKLYQEY